jgi:hypothetical protein
VPDPDAVEQGTARDRTDLAWTRSGLAALACVLVLLRRIWPLDDSGQVAALACISAGALGWSIALWVGRATSGGSGVTRPPLSTRRAKATTAGVLALSLAGLVLAFFPGP